MTFLLPAALGLGVLTLVAIALHGSRPRRVVVPGLLLWQALAGASRRRVPAWRRPRPSLALALQVMIIALLALALARPLLGPHRDVRHWIVVFDNSTPASLVLAGGTGFELALARLSGMASAATGKARLSLIATAGEAEPLAARLPFTRPLLDELRTRLTPGEAQADWAGAARLLQGIRRPGETERIVLISVAPPERARLDLAGEQAATLLPVLDVPPDAGLAARLVAVEPESGRWRLEGEIAYRGMAMPPEPRLEFVPSRGEPLRLAPVAVEEAGPGKAAFAQEVTLPERGPGLLEVSLPDDAGAFNNRARFLLRDAPRPWHVLHVGHEDQPLAAALAAVDGVRVTHMRTLPDDLSSFDMGGFDLLVIEGDAPGPDGIATVRMPTAGEPGLRRPIDAATDHPLMRDVDWTGIAVESTAALVPEAGEVMLLAAADRPLATVDEAGRLLRLAFDPRLSDWPGQPGFAIFAANLVDWLGPMPGGWLEPVCMVGAPCRIDTSLAGGTITDTQSGVTLPLAPDGFVPRHAGLFRLAHGAREGWLAVNPAPPATDDGGSAADGWPIADGWPAEAARALIALALLLLLAEAALAIRRGEGGRWIALRVAAALAILAALVDPPVPLPAAPERVTLLAGPLPAPATGGVVSAGTILRDAGAEDAVAGLERHTDGDMTLRLAAAMLPPGGGELALLGNLPGIGAETLAGLAARGVMLAPAAAPLAGEVPGEVSVEILTAPEPLYAGDTFLLTAVVHSTLAGRADLLLRRDGATLAETAVELRPGPNRIDLPAQAGPAGGAHYEVEIGAENDGLSGNNRRGLWREIAPAPRIAVVADDAGPRDEIVRLLRGQGFDTTPLDPAKAPARASGWRDRDAAVLLNLPAIALTIQQMQALEEAVREDGMGLMILGGPDAFGPGGYLETPLETLSPLSARLPREAPEVAIVFVLDSSGSMTQTVGGQTRIALAKQAVRAAVGLLDARSASAGVIAFNAEAQEVLPLGRIPDAETVARALEGLRVGGGTAIHPGLVAAFDRLAASDAAARHIVVMTDGMSDPADFPTLLGRIRAAGITVSAVAIGSTAETNIAEDIALLGGGRFHATADFEALPSILSQEALMLSTEAIEEGDFPVHPAGAHPELAAGMPPPRVEGLVRATAKPGAEVIWLADTGEELAPLLAHWRYGTGQVLALATAATGRWTAGWQASDRHPRLLAQALRAMLPAPSTGATIRQAGDLVEVELAGAVPPGRLILRALPDGEPRTAIPRQAGPEAWRARFLPTREGLHEILLHGGETVRLDIAFPAALSLRPAPQAAPQAEMTTAYAPALLRPWWLTAALALFMLELVWRYRGPILRPWAR